MGERSLKSEQIKQMAKDFFKTSGKTLAQKVKEIEFEYGQSIADEFFNEYIKINKSARVKGSELLN